ncbi:hypothetical protein JCM10212_002061 [Sporobolomyces blumeae]
MDRSFGASTSTLLATPTPLDRKSRPFPSLSQSTFLNNNQLAHSIGPGSHAAVLQPLSFQANPVTSSSTAAIHPSTTATTTKAVRFSPAHPSTTGGFSNGYSSAPVSRIQSTATPIRTHSSPSLSALNRSSSYGASPSSNNASIATPPRTQQLAKQVSHSVRSAVETPTKAAHEIKHKFEVTPIGRGEAAKRLRVNAVLLVAWWVSSRTAGYRYAAGHLVAVVPSVDTPLHVFETLLLLLLCWNILDSLRALQKLSALPSGQSTVNLALTSPISTKPGPVRSAASQSISTPARSSPKTRPSPSPTVTRFVSPARSTQVGGNASPFRSSALASQSPPTPQTPTSSLTRSVSASSVMSSALGRRTNGIASQSPGRASPLARSVAGPEAPKDEIEGALLAYEARHSPVSARVSLDTKESIDRLFE